MFLLTVHKTVLASQQRYSLHVCSAAVACYLSHQCFTAVLIKPGKLLTNDPAEAKSVLRRVEKSSLLKKEKTSARILLFERKVSF